MGTAEEFQKVLELLGEVKERIATGRIRFADLGVDLIAELIDAGFEEGHSEEDKQAHAALIEAYVQAYKTIAAFSNREAELAYIETLICAIRAWMLMVERQEKDLIERIKDVQGGVLPMQMQSLSEDHVKHTRMDVRELFLQQNASVFELDYQRLDVVIKYLAIEDYFGKNDYGFKLHQKLQALRQRQSGGIDEGYELLSREAFRNLICSIEQNGWDDASEISVDSRLFLADGAHRLAASLYFGVSEIRVQVIDEEINVLPFTLDYLRDGGFTDEEIEIVCAKAEELLQRCKVNISCILWPPVAQYFEQITGEIATGCKVARYQDYVYSEETFPRIVRGIYHIDDIADWKIQMKIDAMSHCPEKKIRVLELEIFAPYFRLKHMNLNTLSTIGENLKRIVRERYMNLVDSYVYDIIVHTGDNFRQSEYIEKLFKSALSLERYFAAIADINYFLVKHETPYTPTDFPKSYAFSKDIDIVCAAKDYAKLEEQTINFLTGEVKGYELRAIRKGDGMLLRVELDGFLIIQLDLSIGMEGIDETFWETALARRVAVDGYYVPAIKDEVCIRVNEYLQKPAKVHHLEYLKVHREAFDRVYVTEYVRCDVTKLDEIEASL